MRRSLIAASSFLILVTSTFAEAPQKSQNLQQGINADPKEVEDPDFRIQGEYTGNLDGQKYGVQVIADGASKFSAVFYPGGLPGDGWDGDRKNRIKGKGETKAGTTRINAPNWSAAVADGKMMVKASKDGAETEAGILERIERMSATSGKKPPSGAIALFDGTKESLEKWENGKLSEDGYLMQGVKSKDKFGASTIHLEFRLPYMPFARGQGRGNSGFYMHARYEVQMLDSFGLEGMHNECGGIYSTKDPEINMCFPPLSWQTYDIDFIPAEFDENNKKTENARMTVHHNGVLIHKDVECDHSTTAAPMREGKEAGPLYFQNHGNQVRYRNIWVLPK
ncbi:MAG: DUF1080 domain-containing protein [Planctomycetota bacterium]|nr:DUF1080 domain-containing protein [Planctomycetota bacterium]MDA1137639.1 DUF1080 domain-containing protein [Planctomycetota bacterium]